MIIPGGPNPYRGERPTKLRTISDADKARAIADAVRETTEQQFSVEIVAIDYSPRHTEKGSFHAPARIDCTVSFDSTVVDEKIATELLRQVVDEKLCYRIAAVLSVRCDEDYMVEILRKHYVPAAPAGAVVELSLLIASAGDIRY